MANKKILLGMLVGILTFGMAVVGCDNGNNSDPDPDVTPTYTVTFDKNTTETVTGLPSEITGVASGEKVTQPTPNPTRADGWGVVGWYREATTTTAWNFGTDTVTADVTLYAKWGTKFEGNWKYEDEYDTYWYIFTGSEYVEKYEEENLAKGTFSFNDNEITFSRTHTWETEGGNWEEGISVSSFSYTLSENTLDIGGIMTYTKQQ